jgi:hypothetical protein
MASEWRIENVRVRCTTGNPIRDFQSSPFRLYFDLISFSHFAGNNTLQVVFPALGKYVVTN